jgi:hypothetical protein
MSAEALTRVGGHGMRVAMGTRMISLRHGADMGPTYSPTRATDPHVQLVVDIIRAEYRDMPCLRLTLRQAMRLWSLDESSCRRHLDALRHEGFLRVTDDGVYGRAID